MEWRVATLPMSHYIVREITTRSVPRRYASYLRSSRQLVVLGCYVSTEFAFCPISNLWQLRDGTTVAVCCGCEKCCYVCWSSSIAGITGAKEMCSVSVSRSKFLRLLVADWHWKCGVQYLSRPFLNGLNALLGCMLTFGRRIVCLHPCNALKNCVGLKRARRKTGTE